MTTLRFITGFGAFVVAATVLSARLGFQFSTIRTLSWTDNESISKKILVAVGTLVSLHVAGTLFYPKWIVEIWQAPASSLIFLVVIPLVAPLFLNLRPRTFFISALVIGGLWGGSFTQSDKEQMRQSERKIAQEKAAIPLPIGSSFSVTAPVGSWGDTLQIPPNAYATYESSDSNSPIEMFWNRGLGYRLNPYGSFPADTRTAAFKSTKNEPVEVKVTIYGNPQYRYGIFSVTAPPDKWSEIVWIPQGEIFRFDSNSRAISLLDLNSGEVMELLPGSQKRLNKVRGARAIQFKSAVPGKSVEVQVQIGKVENGLKNAPITSYFQ